MSVFFCRGVASSLGPGASVQICCSDQTHRGGGRMGKAAGVEEAPACFGHLWTSVDHGMGMVEWSEFRGRYARQLHEIFMDSFSDLRLAEPPDTEVSKIGQVPNALPI